MLTIRFHGHACFGLDLPDGSSLCIDPFEPSGFGGLLPGRPIPDRYSRVVCTHEHADHNATHAIPSARRIAQQHAAPGTQANCHHQDDHPRGAKTRLAVPAHNAARSIGVARAAFAPKARAGPRRPRQCRYSSRWTFSIFSWRSCASIESVAIGRASSRLMLIGSPGSSQEP